MMRGTTRFASECTVARRGGGTLRASALLGALLLALCAACGDGAPEGDDPGAPSTRADGAELSLSCLPPYELRAEQSATYKNLSTAIVLSRSPDLTPQESNEFSAIGIKVDGITTATGRVQFIQKMVQVFG